MKQVDCLVIGGVSRDTLLRLDHLHYDGDEFVLPEDFIFALGKKIYIQDAFVHYGGGGGNVAVSLAKFGLSVSLMARLGKDENAHLMKNYFKRKKVLTTLLQTDPQEKTAFSVVLSTKQHIKDRTILAHRGANAFLKITKKNLTRVKSDWIVVSTLGETWNKDMEILMQTSSRIAWNPGGSQLQHATTLLKKFGRVDILTVNKQEAASLVSVLPKHIVTTRQMMTLLKKIHRMGPRVVAITDGEAGSYIYDGQTMLFANTFKLKKVDITGAGDAFLSGLVAGFCKQFPLQDAFRIANANANHVITKVGAQEGLLSWKQALSFIPKVLVKTL